MVLRVSAYCMENHGFDFCCNQVPLRHFFKLHHQWQADTVTCVFKFLLQSHSIMRATLLAYQSISVIWSITDKILYHLKQSNFSWWPVRTMIEGGIWDEQSRQQFKQFYIVSIDYKEASETKNCWLRNLSSNKTNSAGKITLTCN